MPKKLTYIDLFAGCGGLSVGLHQAGWQGLFAIERNASAFKSLKHNLIEGRKHFQWPSWLSIRNWDIESLLKEKSTELTDLQGKVDLVVGGPPCQGFSTAGRRREGDERNKLVHSYLNFVELVKPRAILFENVRGFTMKFQANPIEGESVAFSEVVTEKLKNLGYNDARGEIIDMSRYGVPQRRRRFIVIATRENLADNIFEKIKSDRQKFLRAKQLKAKNSTRAALSDLEDYHGRVPCSDTKRFFSGKTAAPRTNLQRYFRTNNGEVSPPDSHRFVNHTEAVEAVFVKLLASAPRNYCILGEDRVEYGLKKRSVTVLDPKEPAPTVTSIPDDFVHYSEPRVMTVRECARLQTFPDWFEFKGPYTTGGKQRLAEIPRYTQVGNAFPPLFAEQIGQALIAALDQ